MRPRQSTDSSWILEGLARSLDPGKFASGLEVQMPPTSAGRCREEAHRRNPAVNPGRQVLLQRAMRHRIPPTPANDLSRHGTTSAGGLWCGLAGHGRKPMAPSASCPGASQGSGGIPVISARLVGFRRRAPLPAKEFAIPRRHPGALLAARIARGMEEAWLGARQHWPGNGLERRARCSN